MIVRIAAVSLTALLLVLGGAWLAQRQSNPNFLQVTVPTAQAQEADEEASEFADVASEALEGFEPVPFVTDEPVQSFEKPENVLEEGMDYRALIETNVGSMVVELHESRTPVTVNNFVFLATHRYFEDIVFHRVLEDFMAQTGDPTGTGRGGPGYQFEDEIVSDLTHDSAGTLSMANAGPGTNGSQFFITFTATPWLDGRHTVFGQVVEGLEVLDEIQRIDPQTPNAIVRPGDPLSMLAEQGVELAGEEGTAIETYLVETLGAMPSQGQTFQVDGYTGVVGRLGSELAIGFYAQPDFIERVVIYQRPADTQ